MIINETIAAIDKPFDNSEVFFGGGAEPAIEFSKQGHDMGRMP